MIFKTIQEEEREARDHIIEDGWRRLRAMIAPEMPERARPGGAQLDLLREVFFAGTAHLFAVLNLVDPPASANESELARTLERVRSIADELDRFMAVINARHGRPWERMPTHGVIAADPDC